MEIIQFSYQLAEILLEEVNENNLQLLVNSKINQFLVHFVNTNNNLVVIEACFSYL